MPNISKLKKYRVLLAPITFGAGIKGKITDSWAYGLPVVTTPIGAEGLFSSEIGNEKTGFEYFQEAKNSENVNFGGLWDNWGSEEFVESSIRMYKDEPLWKQSQEIGFEILRKRQNFENHKSQILNLMEQMKSRVYKYQNKTITKTLLWNETFKSTKLITKMINLKKK